MKTKRSEDDTGGRTVQLGGCAADNNDKSKRPALGTITNTGRPVDAKASTARAFASSAAAATAASSTVTPASSAASAADVGSSEDDAGYVARIAEASGVSALPSAASASARQSESNFSAVATIAASVAAASAATSAVPAHEVAVAAAYIPDFVDVDAVDRDDPCKVSEYVEDIYTYLRQLERRFRPRIGYMARQRDINHSMRAILVDWLVEVAEEYRLNLQTLYTSVGYIDRFLSEMSVQRGKLQLVGVTCMLLAAKYEEIYPPAVDEFVYITDHTYTKDQILKMEHLVLKVLRFDMGAVTILTFLERFVKVAMANDRTQHLALYLCELTLQDADRYLKYRSSVLAASAVVVALYIMQLPYWTPTLRHYTQLNDEDIRECTTDLHFTFSNASRDPQQAVYEKYSNARFSSVSRMAAPQNAPVIGMAEHFQ